jgi:hypothetical protein
MAHSEGGWEMVVSAMCTQPSPIISFFFVNLIAIFIVLHK